MLTYGSGNNYDIGKTIGHQVSDCVRANVNIFLHEVLQTNHKLGWLQAKAKEEMSLLGEECVEEIAGIADGSRVPFRDLLLYNLYGDYFIPDGCTVMMAVGDAGHQGNSMLMKNSDQVGSESMVGDGFNQNKEIYVIQIVDPEEGNRIIGLSAAGRTGIKVGVNNKGVAAGSNIARTVELREKKVDISKVRASDRTQLLRDGLQENSAVEASNIVSKMILENPTSTPGSMEFVDSGVGIVIEGSYTHQAIDVVRNDVTARANRFQLLEHTNQPEDVSSVCRYQRCMQLLNENAGELTLEKFREFSRDHVNGPGQNSICRHGSHYREETSLGAAVIEINGTAPEESVISICLGKPCHAWRDSNGYATISFDQLDTIPSGFSDGSVWNEFYSEEPCLP